MPGVILTFDTRSFYCSFAVESTADHLMYELEKPKPRHVIAKDKASMHCARWVLHLESIKKFSQNKFRLAQAPL